MNVQTSKCERNVQFFIKKITELDVRINKLAEALGLELRKDGEGEDDGKTEA